MNTITHITPSSTFFYTVGADHVTHIWHRDDDSKVVMRHKVTSARGNYLSGLIARKGNMVSEVA